MDKQEKNVVIDTSKHRDPSFDSDGCDLSRLEIRAICHLPKERKQCFFLFWARIYQKNKMTLLFKGPVFEM